MGNTRLPLRHRLLPEVGHAERQESHHRDSDDRAGRDGPGEIESPKRALGGTTTSAQNGSHTEPYSNDHTVTRISLDTRPDPQALSPTTRTL